MACRASLDAVGMWRSADWRRNLPDPGLRPEQLDQLRWDVYQQLATFDGLLVKRMGAELAGDDWGGGKIPFWTLMRRVLRTTAGRTDPNCRVPPRFPSATASPTRRPGGSASGPLKFSKSEASSKNGRGFGHGDRRKQPIAVPLGVGDVSFGRKPSSVYDRSIPLSITLGDALRHAASTHRSAPPGLRRQLFSCAFDDTSSVDNSPRNGRRQDFRPGFPRRGCRHDFRRGDIQRQRHDFRFQSFHLSLAFPFTRGRSDETDRIPKLNLPAFLCPRWQNPSVPPSPPNAVDDRGHRRSRDTGPRV